MSQRARHRAPPKAPTGAGKREESACGVTNARAASQKPKPRDETIDDHLLQMFAPQDCQGTDGLPHEEVTAGLMCSCGLALTAADGQAALLSAAGISLGRRAGA
jgi:hypothetical protein